MTTGKL